MKPKGQPGSTPGEPVAGNGILSRRIFLEGALAAGAPQPPPRPPRRNRSRSSRG